MTSLKVVLAESAASISPFWRRLVFTFTASYAFLSLGVGTQPLLPVSTLPWVRQLADVVSRAVFHVPVPLVPQPTGSGDTAFDWAWTLCLLLLAVGAGLVWAARQRAAPTAGQRTAVRTFLRVVLIWWLTVYGLSKFAFSQFGLLNSWQLAGTYGDSSPMGLLWRFMAASPGYQLVAGVAEVLPALLLLHRRTVTVGALVAAVTMTNVFALNLFYDVPVKLFSGHLLLAALVLLALDARRLRAVLTGHEVAAVAWGPRPLWRRALPWLLTALVVVQVGLSLRAGLQALREDRVATRSSPAPLKTRGFNLIQEKPFNR
ncbi:hypothetical protein DM785_10695 [Deinococcus actinosclerus]|nr:hypothetical protein DM785_10695 [Deinococcus actinosclerus]